MTLLCKKACTHWNMVKFCFNIPLVLTSSAMCIIDSIVKMLIEWRSLFPGQNGERFKNVRTRSDRPLNARLPYPTQTCGHWVCIIRKGNPAPRLLTNRGRKNHLLNLSASPRLAWNCSRTDNSEIQSLESPWDTIPIPAQDATQQRGAATTRREASLGRQRRHKPYHGHKDEQTSWFQPSSNAVNTKTHKLQAWRTGTWTRTSSTSKAMMMW